MFPANLVQEIQQFEKLIKWKKVAGLDTEIPEPQMGLDDNFDEANIAVTKIKNKLEMYIDHIR